MGLLLLSPGARAGQLAVNSGFEAGALAPWYEARVFSGNEPWHVTSADAHSGSFAATDVGDREIRQNFAPTPTSDVLWVKFWIKQPDSTAGLSHVTLFYSDNSRREQTYFWNSVNWIQLDVSNLLQPGKLLNGFSAFGYQGGALPEDRTYIDDLDVRLVDRYVVPEPGTLALLAGGLVFFRRRKRT